MMRLKQLPIFSLSLMSLLLLSSCKTPPPPIAAETKVEAKPESHEPALAEYLPSGDRFETIAILGTNDIHGELAPVKLKTREPNIQDTVVYETGGAPVLA